MRFFIIFLNKRSFFNLVKFYFMHISQNELFFLLIYVFFDADSISEIRIFPKALVFEL